MKRIVVALILAVVACARHDDLPAPLGVADPPVPQDFVVETADWITFTLSWDVADPSSIAEYRLYWRFPTTSPELLPETVDTTTVSITVDPPIPAQGIIFCVSSVTLENIESSLVCGTADDSGPSPARSDRPRPSTYQITNQ